MINNVFKSALLSSSIPASTLSNINLNDALTLLEHFPESDKNAAIREVVVAAYMKAWQRGMYVLVAAAVFQIAMSLPLRKVVLDEGKKEKKVKVEEKVKVSVQ